jgi:hypothetical protein
MAADEREEQYVLRVQDRALAERIRKVLREEQQNPEDANIELLFEGMGTKAFYQVTIVP